MTATAAKTALAAQIQKPAAVQMAIAASLKAAIAQGITDEGRLGRWALRTNTGSETCLCTYLMAHGLRFTETADTYRRNNALSNSDISNFVRVATGQGETVPTRAMAIGSALHGIVLEGMQVSDYCVLAPAEVINISKMVSALQAHGIGSMLFSGTASGDREKEYYSKCRVKGGTVHVKCLVDYVRGTEVYDLKSTSAATKEEFQQAIETYRYAQQASFYIDITGAVSFTLIAVSKVNQEVFTVCFKKRSKQVVTARRQYKSVLFKMIKIKK